MHVLIPVHIFLPHHRAGVETYTWQLAHELARRHRVTVATTRKIISRRTGTIRRSSAGRVEILEVVNNLAHEGFEPTYAHPVMEAAFAEVLRTTRPDVVHFQHLMYWSAGVPRLAHEAGIPVFLTLHDFWLSCGRLGQLVDFQGERCDRASPERCAPCLARTPHAQPPAERRWIERLIAIRSATGIPLDRPLRALAGLRRPRGAAAASAPSADEPAVDLHAWRGRYQARRAAFLALGDTVDRFLTPSATVRDAMVDFGLPAERIVRVPQGLDHAPFASVTRQPRTGPLRLGFIGTIAPHKGVDVLIDAVRRLPADRVELTIWGPDDQHRDYAQACVAQASAAPNVRFEGRLERADVARAHERIDVLCVPSLWNECCPLTIQEAFMTRTPCVVTALGGMAELVKHEVGGLTAALGDAEDWARQLARLLDEPGLLARLRAAIPAVPTLDEHVAAILGLYAEVRS